MGTRHFILNTGMSLLIKALNNLMYNLAKREWLSNIGLITIILLLFAEVLDGKEITETSRQFLRKWHANKETQKKKRDEIYQKSAYGDHSGDSKISDL